MDNTRTLLKTMFLRSGGIRLVKTTLVRFLIVGTSGSVILLVLMWLLVGKAGLYYLISLPVAYTIAISSNYLWDSKWTFNKNPGFTGYLKFLASSWVALVINEGVLALVTGVFDIHYLIGTAAGMIAGFTFNYIISKKFVWA